MKQKTINDRVRELGVLGVAQEFFRYFRDVAEGADPIEAMHGHICSDDCWHNQLKKVQSRARPAGSKASPDPTANPRRPSRRC